MSEIGATGVHPPRPGWAGAAVAAGPPRSRVIRHPPWTPEQIAEIRASIAAGMGQRAIAKRFGMTQFSYAQRCKKLGIAQPTKMSAARVEASRAVLRRLYPTERDYRVVLAAYREVTGRHLSWESVRSRGHDLGLVRPPEACAVGNDTMRARMRGQREALVPLVQAGFDAGMSLKGIADANKISRKRIEKMLGEGLVTRKPWVQPPRAPKVEKPPPPPKPRQLPVTWVREPPPPPPPAPPVVGLPAPAANGKIYAPFAAIRSWAAEVGFVYDGGNMDEVNRRRGRMRLALLVQDDMAGAA